METTHSTPWTSRLAGLVALSLLALSPGRDVDASTGVVAGFDEFPLIDVQLRVGGGACYGEFFSNVSRIGDVYLHAKN